MRELELSGPAQVRRALADLGRTEDLQFSPDNRGSPSPGSAHHRVLLVDLAIGVQGGAVERRGDRADRAAAHRACASRTASASSTTAPWSWRTAAGKRPIFSLPPPACGVRQLEVEPVRDDRERASATVSPPRARWRPGRWRALPVRGRGLQQLRQHRSRDTWWTIVTATACCTARSSSPTGLDIPDGVSVSGDRRWLAVEQPQPPTASCSSGARPTSPRTRRRAAELARRRPTRTACGSPTTGATSWSPTRRAAVHRHVYAAEGGDWSRRPRPDRHAPGDGRRDLPASVATTRRRADPKGLDIDRTSSLLAVTSEHQPLALFDARAVLTAAHRPRSACGSHGDRGNEADARRPSCGRSPGSLGWSARVAQPGTRSSPSSRQPDESWQRAWRNRPPRSRARAPKCRRSGCWPRTGTDSSPPLRRSTSWRPPPPCRLGRSSSQAGSSTPGLRMPWGSRASLMARKAAELGGRAAECEPRAAWPGRSRARR